MTADYFMQLCHSGETTQVQFKEKYTSQKEIARELIAFANTKGGVILFGVEDKTGKGIGLSYNEIQTISSELGNAANEQVRPTIYIHTEIVGYDNKSFLVCSVDEGRNKPYKNLQGEIWVKQGADKRRITENSEILALFQDSGYYHPDAESLQGTSFDQLDRYTLDDYLQKVYATSLDGFGGNAEQVLRNIHILHPNGTATLAGYLFFGKHPEYLCPTCMVKAVAFYGNEITTTHYRDTKEILGNMPQLYDKSMAFLKANLHNLQETGASFNTLGKLEIPEEVLEEVLQNALVHRDLLRSAPIRIFVFDNRVEVISPGALAGGLSVDDIQHGKTYQRNPFMATFATNALHYRGIGSGIVRILAEYPHIQLTNDTSAQEFTVTIPRSTQKTPPEEMGTTQKSTTDEISTTQKSNSDEISTTQKSALEEIRTTPKSISTTQKKILDYLRTHPKASRVEVAQALGEITEDGVKFHIAKLQYQGLLRRIGGRKQGSWQVTNP